METYDDVVEFSKMLTSRASAVLVDDFRIEVHDGEVMGASFIKVSVSRQNASARVMWWEHESRDVFLVSFGVVVNRRRMFYKVERCLEWSGRHCYPNAREAVEAMIEHVRSHWDSQS